MKNATYDGVRVCKKCQKVLPPDYKYNLCEACRNKQASTAKKAGIALLGILGTVGTAIFSKVINKDVWQSFLELELFYRKKCWSWLNGFFLLTLISIAQMMHCMTALTLNGLRLKMQKIWEKTWWTSTEHSIHISDIFPKKFFKINRFDAFTIIK